MRVGVTLLDNSTPVVRRGRKARNVEREKVRVRGRPVAEGDGVVAPGGATQPKVMAFAECSRAIILKESTVQMTPSDGREKVVAPERLVSETRADFRARALDAVSRVSSAGGKAVEIDLTDTSEIDASGLGALVLVQKRAKEKSLTVVLHMANGDVRSLLSATRLDGLFEMEHPPED